MDGLARLQNVWAYMMVNNLLEGPNAQHTPHWLIAIIMELYIRRGEFMIDCEIVLYEHVRIITFILCWCGGEGRGGRFCEVDGWGGSSFLFEFKVLEKW